jgi:ABC-type polysaccharide/polyol phosphate transport system ATPase subunit
MSDDMIILKNVSKSFNLKKLDFDDQTFQKTLIRTIDNISLSISRGQMVGLIGKNGSGKTTLLRIISGILSPDEGSVDIYGNVGPLLQLGAGTHDEYTVSENIIVNGLLLGLNKKDIKEKIPEILQFAELEKYRDVKIKYLSAGMRVRIMFSTGMLINPDILLVDEVISVGDASFSQKSLKAFLNFKKMGKTIVFVSHDLNQVQQFCDVVYMMDKGKIVDFGKPDEIIKKYIDFCNP